MGDRPTSKGSLIPTSTWNAMVDMLNWWKRTYAFGRPGIPETRVNATDLVSIGNDTADDLSIGHVLELDAKMLATINSSDPAWLVGVKPTKGNVNIAVLLYPCKAKSGSTRTIVHAQTTGTCFVKVSVGATWHRRARPVKDAYVLTSGLFGPCEILSELTATGEQLCLCSVGHADNRGMFAKTTSSITAASLSSGKLVLGSGTAAIYDPYATTASQYEDVSHSATIYNMAGDPVDTGGFVHILPTDDWLPLIDIDPCTQPV